MSVFLERIRFRKFSKWLAQRRAGIEIKDGKVFMDMSGERLHEFFAQLTAQDFTNAGDASSGYEFRCPVELSLKEFLPPESLKEDYLLCLDDESGWLFERPDSRGKTVVFVKSEYNNPRSVSDIKIAVLEFERTAQGFCWRQAAAADFVAYACASHLTHLPVSQDVAYLTYLLGPFGVRAAPASRERRETKFAL